jgi:hypothetical protein
VSRAPRGRVASAPVISIFFDSLNSFDACLHICAVIQSFHVDYY